MSESVPANTLLSPRFLFHFEIPVRQCEAHWTKKGVTLGEEYRLVDLAQLDDGFADAERPFADVRMAWNRNGLMWSVTVPNRSKALWCRESRPDQSDGLQLWIDTRATHNVHRATRYCHRFAFLPAGGGRDWKAPHADQLLINRARENAPPIRPSQLKVVSRVKSDSYFLAAFAPADALFGFDPDEQPRIGFNYLVQDMSHGAQTFSQGGEMPYDEDPSCWATLHLVSV